MEVHRTQVNNNISQLKCWTKWIRDNKNRLRGLSTWPHQHLKMRDGRFRYTIVHALMAGDIEEEVVKQCFSVLRKNSLISLITAKDKEGDTPLHSAIRSGAKPELIKLLMNTISKPSTKRRLLLELNKKGELPIINAFNLKEWPVVEVLLEECIKCKLLPELTGMDPNVSESKTLLFKAMKRGFIRYLEIFLRVCQKCTNYIPVRAMLVPNKWGGYTPWYHFLCLDVEQIKLGLEHLKEYGVDINKLLCDPAGRTSLLHEAYRRNNTAVCELLIDHGARPNQLDANKLSPQQRRRTLSISSRPSTPIHEPIHAQFQHQAGIQERILEEHEAISFEHPVSVQENTSEGEQREEDEERNNANKDERSEQEVRSNGSRARHHTGDSSDCSCLTGRSETEQLQGVNDVNRHLRVVDVHLLEALNLEFPCRSRQPLTCLSPRQEKSPNRCAPVCVVPSPWKLERHLECFQQCFIGDNNRPLFLKCFRCTCVCTSHYAQVDIRPYVDEICPIMNDDQCVRSFNTITGPLL